MWVSLSQGLRSDGKSECWYRLLLGFVCGTNASERHRCILHCTNPRCTPSAEPVSIFTSKLGWDSDPISASSLLNLYLSCPCLLPDCCDDLSTRFWLPLLLPKEKPAVDPSSSKTPRWLPFSPRPNTLTPCKVSLPLFLLPQVHPFNPAPTLFILIHLCWFPCNCSRNTFS